MEIGKGKLERAETVDRFVPVRDFTDLETWQLARELRRDIYQVCKSFPREETFGLTSQIKRAAISVTANIAEGFGRFSYQENIQFSRQSRGSIYEVRDHLTAGIGCRLSYKRQIRPAQRESHLSDQTSQRLHTRDDNSQEFKSNATLAMDALFPISLFQFPFSNHG